MQSIEMRYLRTGEDSDRLDRIEYGNIERELKIQKNTKLIVGHRQNRMKHLARMTDERILKLILQDKPNGRRDQGSYWERCSVYVKMEKASLLITRITFKKR
jgi:hypothetical protein